METIKDFNPSEFRPKFITFSMIRNGDETGISGKGHVLDGIVFEDGRLVVEWSDNGLGRAISMFNSFDEFYKIHIKPHPTNNTEIIIWQEKEKPQIILK